MKNERKLRVSGLNDYIAVDIVNEKGVILSTPFYLTHKDLNKRIKYKDHGQSFLTSVFMADNDKQYLLCRDSTGFDFTMPYNELLDPTIVNFLP